MEILRIRIIWADGRISVLDKTFSQTVEMLGDISRELRGKFWDKKSVDLPNGSNVKFVKNV